MGESIVYSWLRHTVGCQVVQLNWKSSAEWPESIKPALLQSIMDKAKSKLGAPFKKTATISQLLRQAEIDGVGININKKEIHAADVAFHEAGLSYGSKEETIRNIIKKMMRTTIALEVYFPKSWKKNIYFISPKINPAVLDALHKAVAEIEAFLIRVGLKTKVHLIANRDFNSRILRNLKSVAQKHSDTSELFLRSLQLTNMFPDIEK